MLIRSYLTHGVGGALFMIDLDNFKQLNDTRGHESGDQMLMVVGRCLRETFRHTDVLGRFGGDEFLVYLLSADEETAEKYAREFLAAMERQTAVQFQVTCSVGIAVPADTDETYEELFERADRALYQVKGSGKHNYRMADPPAEPEEYRPFHLGQRDHEK
jgi:diguanylate cyclase (GGDEF)-like protein